VFAEVAAWSRTLIAAALAFTRTFCSQFPMLVLTE